MINENLYHKTVDILVQAYFNNDLCHGNCYACAVGNLCKQPAKELNISEASWAAIFYTDSQTHEQYQALERGVTHVCYKGSRTDGLKLIKSTGYMPIQLAKIEHAFETAPKGKSEDEWMFNGLCAVLDVLKEIHQVDDNISIDNKSKISNVYKRNMERCS